MIATKETVLDGIVPMDGMQKAVAKNMEKTRILQYHTFHKKIREL